MVAKDEKITFTKLSAGLKTAIVMAWISGIIFVLSFLIGFLSGLMSG
jgi:hypothetical protein